MTQEELAEKCGTHKSYISRVENNAGDIRLSTLMKIIQTGLGGHLKLTLHFDHSAAFPGLLIPSIMLRISKI